MPNWIENRVTITGDKKTLKEIQKLMKTKQSIFDFNALIPRPPEFDGIFSGSAEIDGKRVELWREIGGKKFALPDAEREALLSAYGADNWYEWNCKNWGVKWNATPVIGRGISNGYIFGNKNVAELFYHFDTPWSDPRPIFDALQAKFPSIHIHVEVGGEVDTPFAYDLEPEEVSSPSKV